MQSTLDSTLSWWIAWPILGLVIVSFLALTDLVHGSAEGRGLRSWRTLLVIGMVLGGLGYALLAGFPDAGRGYSWLDAAHVARR